MRGGFKLTQRHHPRCHESRWQFNGGHEVADARGNINGRGRYYVWQVWVCVSCKQANALVRADLLAHVVTMLEQARKESQ